MLFQLVTILGLTVAVATALSEQAQPTPISRAGLFHDLTDVSKQYPAECPPTLRCHLYVYRLGDPESARFKLTFVILRIEPPFRLQVLDLRESGRVPDVFERAASGAAAAALINGGFFGFDGGGAHIPLGLVVANGRVKCPKHPWTSGGVVSATKVGVTISRTRQFALSQDIIQALQSKPLLVEDGGSGIRSDDGALFDRSAFGVSQNGEGLLTGAFTESGRTVTLKEFAQLLLDWAEQQHVKLGHVLAMDGGPGAHLYLPRARQHFGSDVDQFVPNVIRVETP